MKLRSMCHKTNEGGEDLFPDKIACKFEDPKRCIDVPPFIGREAFCCKTYLCCQGQLEFVVCDLEENKELPYQDAHILFVDQSIRELEGSTSYGDVAITKAVEYDISVALDSVRVHCYDLV